MKGLSQISLAKKLTISVIALLASCIIVITFMTYMTIVHFGNNFLSAELNQRSEFIKKAFTEPIWTYDQYQIEEIGNSLIGNFKYTFISAIKVETSLKELLFEKGQDYATFQEATKMPNTKSRIIDIYKDGRKIGVVSVAMTNYGYIRAFKEQFLLLAIGGIVLLIVLAKVVSYYITRTLTKPMSKILDQVHQIEKDLYVQHDTTNLPQELESISKALNQASSVIEKRNNDIKFYTNDLERLVLERTSALEDQMTKNANSSRLAAVGELAADVAHEVNNPLTIIDLHAAKLKKYETEFNLSPTVTYSIDKIQVMIKRIGKIIKGLKTLSRDGNADPMVGFSIVHMLDDVLALIEMKLKTNGIQFEIILEKQELEVIGREVQISQVMVNLVGNAIDAIAERSEKWIRVEVFEKDERVYVAVTDSGEGIAENILEKIMHPFFTTKEVNKGTGLGLSISKDIIEEHGGSLEYNRFYKNTQFLFSLQKNHPSSHILEKTS